MAFRQIKPILHFKGALRPNEWEFHAVVAQDGEQNRRDRREKWPVLIVKCLISNPSS